MLWTLLEIVRVSEVDLAAGVPAAHEAAVVLEDGAGAPSVQQLTLLTLVQVQADHLVLDAPHQQLGGPLGIPASSLFKQYDFNFTASNEGDLSMHCISVMCAEW